MRTKTRLALVRLLLDFISREPVVSIALGAVVAITIVSVSK